MPVALVEVLASYFINHFRYDSQPISFNDVHGAFVAIHWQSSSVMATFS